MQPVASEESEARGCSVDGPTHLGSVSVASPQSLWSCCLYNHSAVPSSPCCDLSALCPCVGRCMSWAVGSWVLRGPLLSGVIAEEPVSVRILTGLSGSQDSRQSTCPVPHDHGVTPVPRGLRQVILGYMV